jgi:hypothetical protein
VAEVCVLAQVLDSWADQGGIAKLVCNQISINTRGEWLLPFWHELGGSMACQQVPKLHGVAGVYITPDQVQLPRPRSLRSCFLRSGTGAREGARERPLGAHCGFCIPVHLKRKLSAGNEQSTC